MFKVDSSDALLRAFRPKDRALVEVAPHFSFPLAVHDTLSWAHPAGGRMYLVFAVRGGAPTGICFDSNGGAPGVPSMCSWCHHSGTGSEVGLLSATLNSRKRVGILVCSDLSCQQKLEDLANRQGSSARPAIEKLVERMGTFARDVLKMDLSGTRR